MYDIKDAINRRILIIDDNEAIHKDFRIILEKNSEDDINLNKEKNAIFDIVQNVPISQTFEVDSAFQGQEGLKKIRQALQDGRPYAMAFVDVRMPPGWDGVETIEKIWQEYPDLQVVICTAYSDYSWHDIIKKLGETEKLLILKKPFDNIEVYQLASAMTAKWHLSQQARIKYDELERIVKERTCQLQETNTELQEANKELAIALDEAERAEKAKSEFLANMSHEIRTPMNSVIGFSDILFEEDLTKDQKEYVRQIRQCGKNLMQIINDILDFSKIEAGKLEIESIECDINQLLDGIGSILHLQAHEKGLKFEILRDDRLPAVIITDPGRLRQCLVNLIGNAIKFTEKGFVHLTVFPEDRNSQPYIRFDVEDTGIGIPAKAQQEVFNSFTQADGSTSRKYGGTGLGLTITKRLAELLGGELTLTSEEGKGSIFSLAISAGIDITRQQALDVYNINCQIDSNNEKKKPSEFSGQVLIAEDVEANRKLIDTLLNRIGLNTTVAKDGNEAVQKALDNKYDLILMDIQMPGINGFEATKSLRQSGIKTPVVALTACAMKEDKQKCLEAGCDDYLTKPIDQRQLLEIIAKHLPSKPDALSEIIDSAKSQVDKLADLNLSKTSKGSCSKERSCVEGGEELINLGQLTDRLGDEELISEIVSIFLKESKERFDMLSEAVKSKDIKAIKFYSHAIKGAARNVGAKRLSDIASQLESAGMENDIETTKVCWSSLKIELEKVVAFLSQPNWIEVAKSEKAVTR